MRNQFYQHAQMTNEEVLEIWGKCIFVFDTNILLSFYRYSPGTVKELESVLNAYKERIWLPHQVGAEFFKNRLTVIQEQINNYENTLSGVENINSLLSRKRGHPFVEDNLIAEFAEVSARIKASLSKEKESILDLLENDRIADSILNVFNDKIGNELSNEQLNGIYDEGKIRYEKRIPPGFMDKKSGNGRYVDLIIWKQIIEKAKAEKRPIVFVCDDAKEDWWLKVKGKTISPLPDLVKEFNEESGQKFHMYSAFRFIEYAYNNRNIISSQPTIDEIKQVSATNKSLFDYNTIEIVIYALELLDASINGLNKYLESMGYVPVAEIIDGNLFKLVLRVPFEDLVRRVEMKVKNIAPNLNLEIRSFTHYPDTA